MSSRNEPTWAEQYLQKHASDPASIHAGLMLELSETISRYMEECGITRTELASRMGCSRAYITKLLGGSCNYTLETLIKISLALDLKLKIELLVESVPATQRKTVYSHTHKVKKVAEE